MTKFSDLKLDPNVLKAIAEAGYETPTPIQAGAIPPALEGRDVLGIAQTGTGKTASFTLPMITLLGRGRARARMPRSLVLAPTRELAAQVAENFDTYAKHTRLTKALLIGGVSFGEQDKLIDRGVDVLIATPGRLLDHFERGKLLLTGVQIMVVDEADRMLDMGFIPDIERIFQLTPFTRQTLFFSATMAPEIERITDTFLHSPERVEVARQATTSETITQRLVEITPTRKDQTAKQKRELLRALIDAEGEALTNAIIFCNRKTDVDIVAKSLKAHGYDAAPIHGDLEQKQRMRTLDDFREGKLRFLIASDVAARGLDIPAVSHVLNFDLPGHAEDYVHRIGRTGRAGRTGTAISLATPSDEKLLAAIETLVKQTLPRAPLPENFRVSSAAQNAPRGSARSERDSRSHDRRRTSGRRDHQDSKDTHMPHDRAQATAGSASSSPSIERAESRHDSRQGAAGDSHHRDQRTEPRRDRRRDDHRRGGDHQPVMGMGDHIPDFLTRSFRPGFTTPAGNKAEDGQDEQVTITATPEAPAEKTAPGATPARTSTRSRRGGRTQAASSPADKSADKSEKAAEAAPAETAASPEAATAEVTVPEDTLPKTAVPEAVPAAEAGNMGAEGPAAAQTATPETEPAPPPAAAEQAGDTAPGGAAQDAASPETAAEAAEADAEPAPKPVRRRTTRTTTTRKTTTTKSAAGKTKAAADKSTGDAEPDAGEPVPAKAPARRRSTRKPPAAKAEDSAENAAPATGTGTEADTLQTAPSETETDGAGTRD